MNEAEQTTGAKHCKVAVGHSRNAQGLPDHRCLRVARSWLRTPYTRLTHLHVLLTHPRHAVSGPSPGTPPLPPSSLFCGKLALPTKLGRACGGRTRRGHARRGTPGRPSAIASDTAPPRHAPQVGPHGQPAPPVGVAQLLLKAVGGNDLHARQTWERQQEVRGAVKTGQAHQMHRREVTIGGARASAARLPAPARRPAARSTSVPAATWKTCHVEELPQ